MSPYTGEALPRAAFEPARGAVASRGRPKEVEEDEADLAPASAEVVSLEDVSAGEEAEAAGDDETVIEEEAAAEDPFLEEEEEAGDDVADLIDGDIEDEEET